MYNDYPAIYETNLNEYLIYWIIFGIVAVILTILVLLSLSKIFKKANRSGLIAWIPIYNLYTLTEICNLPKYYIILLLIPIVNIIFIIRLSSTLAKLFKKSDLFGIGLALFPFIYYPILAFSDSEYIGINLVAMEGTTTIEEIPVIDENKIKTEVEVNDKVDEKLKKVDISIGGGMYQKGYTSNLKSADSNQTLYKNKKQPVKEVNRNNIKINPGGIFSVQYIETNNNETSNSTNQQVNNNQNTNSQNAQPVNNQNTQSNN